MIRGVYIEFPEANDYAVQDFLDREIARLVVKGVASGWYIAPPENPKLFPSLVCVEAECEGK